jgi:hypothetical protein
MKFEIDTAVKITVIKKVAGWKIKASPTGSPKWFSDANLKK